MKYEPERFRPRPEVKPPTDISAYFAQADKARRDEPKPKSKRAFVMLSVITLVCIAFTEQGGLLFLPICALLFWVFFIKKTPAYKKATSPLPYTPRS